MFISEKTLNLLYLETKVGQKLMLTVDGETKEYTVIYKDPVRVELSKDSSDRPILATTWSGLHKKLYSI